MGDGADRRALAPALAGTVLLLATAAEADPTPWPTYQNETATRLVAEAMVGVNDVQEKDFAWGDVDQDGDIDLVSVRKQPWNTPGRFRNVLFMNEDGVLVDRTNLYATAADDGGHGFRDATADRDVALVDVDGDGWLDVVTATTYGAGLPKTISHPRVYINLKQLAGAWQGFRYEQARTPEMPIAPNFCGIGYGDVTGDDAPDLYFVDYNNNLEDRLWVNDGRGVFADESVARLTFEMRESDFGVHAVIADLNGDGVRDIVKDRGSTPVIPPLRISAIYNDVEDEGFFAGMDTVYNGNPYHVEVGDLNGDGRLDLVVEDDGTDRYFLNQGNNAHGLAEFTSFTFAPAPDSFGGNIRISDLNNDGQPDVAIADVDVDCCGCDRAMHIWQNRGDAPNVTFFERSDSIPLAARTGTQDVAVFDLDGDGWKDLVLGTCSGISVWIADPPQGIDVSYPKGVPEHLYPGQATAFDVELAPYGGPIEAGSERLHYSVDGASPLESVPLEPLGAGLYRGTLPPSACFARVDFFVSAELEGQTYSDPPDAPATMRTAFVAAGLETVVSDGFEGDVSGWSVANANLSGGAWLRADPEGTFFSANVPAAPDADAEAGAGAHQAFVTGNGVAGGGVGDADVDGGPTDLLSPAFQLGALDGIVSYSRWAFSSGDDQLTVWITADGSSWQQLESVSGSHNSWEAVHFRAGDFVPTAGSLRLRFRAADNPNNSITEAAVDAFRVQRMVCQACDTPGVCDDGTFCNGAELCLDGFCAAGAEPCAGQACDEADDACVSCLDDAECDDGTFCNGAETCAGDRCLPGTDPCPGQFCDELDQVCAECLTSPQCDDGLFCNGVEVCSSGNCAGGVEPCAGRRCDEARDTCSGTVTLQPRMGQPLFGLTPAELDRFMAGRAEFSRVLTAADGLGPVFNETGCAKCHNNPIGGSGTITVTRFGHVDGASGEFDPLESLGGSLLQTESTSPSCAESLPPPAVANVTAARLTNSTLGFGLVEALAGADLEAHAASPPPGTSGRVHWVAALEDPPGSPLRVGRFGWKSQVATVLSFSADALLNEMGVTNRLVGAENDPNGLAPPSLGRPDDCDSVSDPEDRPAGPGAELIDRLTDFQRLLAPPPQTPRSGMSGALVFQDAGCAGCHVPAFTTPASPALEPVLRGVTIRPYSDFLLHDMGQAADFIEQGDAEQREMRTPPLWGLRARDPLWHDGRVAGGTFPTRVEGAIALHAAVGSEALSSAEAFASLAPAEQAALVAFLDSLGRAEFDHDGDNDVDQDDYTAFQGCASGPGSFTPDDPCSISDVDQDGDVDGADFDLFMAAADGGAGSVPDGGLRLSRGAGDEVVLSWDPSCLAADVDYAVYEGQLTDFTSHVPRLCSTRGSTSAAVATGGDAYYLVVPTNGFREGSYGANSAGEPRPPSREACLPQASAACAGS